MIIKENGKYIIKSEKGKKLGSYSSKKQALKRLRQIEFFKHKKYTSDQISSARSRIS